ncbi:hypothetical protein Tco_0384485, partial [Tanacetum coccineum]
GKLAVDRHIEEEQGSLARNYRASSISYEGESSRLELLEELFTYATQQIMLAKFCVCRSTADFGIGIKASGRLSLTNIRYCWMSQQ